MLISREYADEVEQFLLDHRLYASVTRHSDLPVLIVDINSGDWKHEHLRTRALLVKHFNVHYLWEHRYQGSDDDDCYSAQHYFHVESEGRKEGVTQNGQAAS